MTNSNTMVNDDRVVELSRELLATNSLSPFIRHNSSPRQQMFSAQHLSQLLVIKNPSERYIQTGMEAEFGKYTFNKKAPCDMEVIKVIRKYSPIMGAKSVPDTYNPMLYVIYENIDTKEVGLLELPSYSLNDMRFGFDFIKTEAYHKLRQGAMFQKGTVFMHSPNLTNDGGYMYGKEVNVAYMNLPAVAEDGIIVSESILEDFSYTTYETRVVEFGSNYFPRNLYGDEENFKPFPDIGDKLRDDGLLAALCRYDHTNTITQMSRYGVMQYDSIFDKLTYVDGSNGVVVNVTVYHDPYSRQVRAPEGMDEYLEKYDLSRRHTHQEIYNIYQKLLKDRKDRLRITPHFQRYLVETIAILDQGKDKRIDKLYRLNPIDDWRIEFVIKYEKKPTLGAKLTDTSGSKGVICQILPDHHMPVDKDGNRADVVVDPLSTISRMNVGRSYEHYINSCSRDIRSRFRRTLNINDADTITIEQLRSIDVNILNEFLNTLGRYYEIISPIKMFQDFFLNLNQDEKLEHLLNCINEWIYLYLPPDNEVEYIEVIKELEKFVQPTFDTVTFKDVYGKTVESKSKVRIAPMYYLMLEKTGDSLAAVNSVKLQNFGIISQLSPHDRHGTPIRQQPDRSFGESEMRLILAYSSPEIVAEIMDRNGNMESHKEIVNTLLECKDPANIEEAVDRRKVPLSGPRSLTILNHLLMTMGVRLTKGEFNPNLNLFSEKTTSNITSTKGQ